MSLVGLTALTLFIPGEIISVSFGQKVALERPRQLGLCVVLFVLCLLAVFRVLPYAPLTVVVAAAFLLTDRALLRRVDYCLLLTFVCFFIFSGNLGSIPLVRDGLSRLMERSALLTSVLASQVISNVPPPYCWQASPTIGGGCSPA